VIILEIEIRNYRSTSLQNTLWKGLKAELTQHTVGNKGGRRRRLKLLLDIPSDKEYSGSNRPLWRSRFGIDYGPKCPKTITERQKEDEDEEEDVSSYWIKLGQGIIGETEIRNKRSTSVENQFWNGLWSNCGNTL